jgi:hypothetical protein
MRGSFWGGLALVETLPSVLKLHIYDVYQCTVHASPQRHLSRLALCLTVKIIRLIFLSFELPVEKLNSYIDMAIFTVLIQVALDFDVLRNHIIISQV